MSTPTPTENTDIDDLLNNKAFINYGEIVDHAGLKAAITKKLRAERLDELKDLWLLCNEDCETCDDNKDTIQRRISDLQAEETS
jgi:hypothetical protein